MPIAEIISQGDEVVTGQVVDTNAAWLAEHLVAMGFAVARHCAVPDDLDAIRQAMLRASARADLVVCTGGLGPTDDDLTAQAVAAAFQRPLELDPEALQWVQAVFAHLGRPMPEVNRKQAWLPRGSTRLHNGIGTACGFAFEHDGALVACLPGVPREVVHLWEEQLRPLLGARFQVSPGSQVVVHTTGIGESTLQERLAGLSLSGVQVGFRTVLPVNQVKLSAGPDIGLEVLQAAVHRAVQRIGTPVFAVQWPGQPEPTLAGVVGELLLQQGATLATAESCTGGRVAALCTAVSGSSGWFTEGAVTYANAAKERLLGVPAADIAEHGAVSEVVARRMAAGVRAAAGTTWGVSTTGIAGPTGGTPDKPVGTVHIAAAGPQAAHHRLLRLRGERQRIQRFAASAALDLLRRALAGTLS